MSDSSDSLLLFGDELEQAIEDAEWSDEYDDVPRYSELTDEEKAAHQTLGEDFVLAAGLDAGCVPEVGTVIERDCAGSNRAEALGRAYHTRDQIQEAGGECEVEYIEPTIVIGHRLYHRIEITITSD